MSVFIYIKYINQISFLHLDSIKLDKLSSLNLLLNLIKKRGLIILMILYILSYYFIHFNLLTYGVTPIQGRLKLYLCYRPIQPKNKAYGISQVMF